MLSRNHRLLPIALTLCLVLFAQSVQAQLLASPGGVSPIPMRRENAEQSVAFGNFLKSAKSVESAADSLQRCVAYPDPPGSHWSREATAAYCRYMSHPIISLPEVESLVKARRTADLDRRFAATLDEQRSNPDARGLLDRTFNADFLNDSTETRKILDAWKKQSPDSAFAYTASGLNYYVQASKARGSKYANETAASQFEAMRALTRKAREDLERAVAIDPRMTPAYATMVDIGSMEGDLAYSEEAGRRGLAVDPANYSIYVALLEKAEPKWGGSLKAMRQIADEAKKHSDENPMLLMLLTSESAYAADLRDCNCQSSPTPDDYNRVLDDVATPEVLAEAAMGAKKRGYLDLALVYESEALRFRPDFPHTRAQRADNLLLMGEQQWALDDLSKLLKVEPKQKDVLISTAQTYASVGDFKGAERAYEMALAMAPNDSATLVGLGHMFAYQSRQWDKAWGIANQLIKANPDNPQGWIIRATVQREQPRAGLRETIDHFIKQFGDDPTQQITVQQMRRTLVEESP